MIETRVDSRYWSYINQKDWTLKQRQKVFPCVWCEALLKWLSVMLDYI